MDIENLFRLLLIIGLVSILFYICFKLINRFAFILNLLLMVALGIYGVQDNQWIPALLFLGCPLLLINTLMYVFLHKVRIIKKSIKNTRSVLRPPKENLNWKILNGVLPLLALPEAGRPKAWCMAF